MLTIFAANSRSRFAQHFRLQLYRLPQNHRVHVCFQLYGCEHALKACPRERESESILSVRHDTEKGVNDKSLLLYLRNIDVPDRFGLAWSEHSPHWDG